MQMFERLSSLVIELKETNSNNNKIDILTKYPDCTQLLLYTFDSFKQYGITSENLKKKKNVSVPFIKYTDFFILLDHLRNGKLTGHLAITTVNDFCNDHINYKELIYSIIDKDLKCRIGIKTINKAFPGLIPTFEVALAKDYSEYSSKINFKQSTWYASRKLDGVRCIAIKNGRTVSFFSRTGKPFYTLGKLAEVLLDHPTHGFVLDGEVCIINEEGIEDFKAIVSEVRKKDHTIKNPKYKVFDFLSLEDFLNGSSDKDLVSRFLDLFMFTHSCDTPMIDKLDQEIVTSVEQVEALKADAVSRGWEGYILRKNTRYEAKRTKDMLKVKTFFDEEFVVERTENNIMRCVVEDKDGHTKEIEEEMMAKVFIMYKGCEVGVGSGWNLEERRQYYKTPEDIIGKVITVQHFGESTNDQGGLSLRFPTVKYNYGEEREV